MHIKILNLPVPKLQVDMKSFLSRLDYILFQLSEKPGCDPEYIDEQVEINLYPSTGISLISLYTIFVKRSALMVFSVKYCCKYLQV